MEKPIPSEMWYVLPWHVVIVYYCAWYCRYNRFWVAHSVVLN